jgi:hypothetical protein
MGKNIIAHVHSLSTSIVIIGWWPQTLNISKLMNGGCHPNIEYLNIATMKSSSTSIVCHQIEKVQMLHKQWMVPTDQMIAMKDRHKITG